MSLKIKTLIYLACIAGITVTAFVFAPFSFTSIFMAAAFVLNLLLFADNFKRDK
jgi:hypothetical protein